MPGESLLGQADEVSFQFSLAQYGQCFSIRALRNIEMPFQRLHPLLEDSNIAFTPSNIGFLKEINNAPRLRQRGLERIALVYDFGMIQRILVGPFSQRGALLSGEGAGASDTHRTRRFI